MPVLLSGTWKPTGVWLTRANVIDRIHDARETIGELCKASGLSRYHDALLSEILDVLVKVGYAAWVAAASTNEQHYNSTYRVAGI